MSRTVSSVRPRGAESISISVMKPCWYSCFTNCSMVSVAVLIQKAAKKRSDGSGRKNPNVNYTGTFSLLRIAPAPLNRCQTALAKRVQYQLRIILNWTQTLHCRGGICKNENVCSLQSRKVYLSLCTVI